MTVSPVAIPALDTLAEMAPDRVPWSRHDEEVMATYYGRGRITPEDIKPFLDTPRSVNAIQSKAAAMGLTRRA